MKNILILIVLVIAPYIAHASLSINEIMYDPKGANTNHQWIEVYNSGDNAVSIDAGTWRFNDGSSHYMNNKVDFTVPPDSYFILTGDRNTFMADHTGYSGMVIDTSMSLDKDGGAVFLFNDKSPVTSANYSASMGGAEDGNSLQKVSGAWTAAVPTPGAQNNSIGTISDNLNTSSNVSDSGTTKTATKIKEPEIPKITSEIIVHSIVLAGVDFTIDQKTTGIRKENINWGRFVWNFGDGTSAEYGSGSESFLHRYEYPGEYLVTLSYYENNFKKEPDSSDRILVRAVSPNIVISSVGSGSDPFVEVENKSVYEVQLSSWILKGSVNSFVIPDGTTILPNKKIKFSSRITHFNIDDVKNIILSTSASVVAAYPDTSKKDVIFSGDKIIKYSQNKNTSSGVGSKSNKKYKEVINLNDIAASAGSAGTSIPWNWIIPISLSIFGCAIFYTFISYKKGKWGDGDNLGSPIRPEDISILD